MHVALFGTERLKAVEVVGLVTILMGLRFSLEVVSNFEMPYRKITGHTQLEV